MAFRNEWIARVTRALDKFSNNQMDKRTDKKKKTKNKQTQNENAYLRIFHFQLSMKEQFI